MLRICMYKWLFHKGFWFPVERLTLGSISSWSRGGMSIGRMLEIQANRHEFDGPCRKESLLAIFSFRLPNGSLLGRSWTSGMRMKFSFP